MRFRETGILTVGHEKEEGGQTPPSESPGLVGEPTDGHGQIGRSKAEVSHLIHFCAEKGRLNGPILGEFETGAYTKTGTCI